MENRKGPALKETPLDDSIRLAIREEVERRFDAPPASFANRIENEVEKRVEQRVKHYKTLGLVVMALVGAFAVILWNASLSTVRKTIASQLSEQEVIKAKDRIIAIKSTAEDINRNLSDISRSMTTNEQKFTERLKQIREQDNVLLTDDLSKVFVIQAVTNLLEGRKIVLNYEPIRQTIKIRFHPAYATPLDIVGNLEGNTIILNKDGLSLTNQTPNGLIRVEYVRKSFR